MSFSCSLDRRGLKSFRSTLASLAKVGSEVNLEATPDSLLVRALAPSHAAFALVTLRRGFFVPHSFESRPMTSSQLSAPPQTVGASQSQSQSHTFIKCKVSLKQVMVVFRNSHAAERMDIELSTKENKMWCHLQVGGVLTRYGVPFESQSNILQADFHSSAADSFLVFKSNLLSRALDNFTARTAEVTLVIDAMETPEREMAVEPMIRLKNFEQNQAHTHTAGLSLLQETMNTESDIPQSQLEACHMSDPTCGVDLTFNVKEVRAFLSYCDSLTDPPRDVRLRWVASGQPIKLETQIRQGYAQSRTEAPSQDSDEDVLHMQLVVATLADPQGQSQESTPQPNESQSRAAAAAAAAPVAAASQEPRLSASPSFRQKQSAAAAPEPDYTEDEVPPTP